MLLLLNKNFLAFTGKTDMSSKTFCMNCAIVNTTLFSAHVTGQLAVGVDVDCQDGWLYWTDAAYGRINRVYQNGSASDVLVEGKHFYFLWTVIHQ